jgi:16S rRNA (adenine1518-N6/adenine1519-N6)-dimethyltransferase
MTERRHRPIKRLGQHFLSPAWASKVVAAIAPRRGDVFLEIGPGTGALTRPLAAAGAPIVAIELDARLASDLARHAPPHVTVWSGDILEMDVVPLLLGLEPQRPPASANTAGHAERRYRIVGNLPYYIASPILFRLVELQRQHRLFSDATLMVQREMADRLVASPRSKAYGVLTIMISLHSHMSRLLELPPGAFTPPPKVKSSVVRLEFTEPRARIVDERLFEQLVKAMFSKRRKTLANALKSFSPSVPAALAHADIDPRRRPETLTLAEIARIVEFIATARRPAVL